MVVMETNSVVDKLGKECQKLSHNVQSELISGRGH